MLLFLLNIIVKFLHTIAFIALNYELFTYGICVPLCFLEVVLCPLVFGMSRKKLSQAESQTCF